MKFSLREVFDIHASSDDSASETSSLLEMYGLSSDSETAERPDASLEGIQAAVNQILEGRAPEKSESHITPAKKTVNRDDLVLDRWRKMAGL